MSPQQAQDWVSSPGSATWGTSSPSKVPSHQLSVGADHTPPASTSSSLLSPEVAMLTLQDHPELRALLSLLPSKQHMCTLASDFKSAWRQDLQTVQTDVGELQQKVQRLEDSQASMQQLISSVQACSSIQDSLHHTLAKCMLGQTEHACVYMGESVVIVVCRSAIWF